MNITLDALYSNILNCCSLIKPDNDYEYYTDNIIGTFLIDCKKNLSVVPYAKKFATYLDSKKLFDFQGKRKCIDITVMEDTDISFAIEECMYINSRINYFRGIFLINIYDAPSDEQIDEIIYSLRKYHKDVIFMINAYELFDEDFENIYNRLMHFFYINRVNFDLCEADIENIISRNTKLTFTQGLTKLASTIFNSSNQLDSLLELVIRDLKSYKDYEAYYSSEIFALRTVDYSKKTQIGFLSY